MSALQREVADLDQVIHALHALVDQMEKDAGKYALRMFGNTRRVHALLGTLENKTHSMQNRSQNTGQGQSYYGGNQGSSSSRYGYPASGSSSRHTYPNQPSHKYPSNGSRSQNERANDHDDDHDDRSGGGNIFQRIHRKHLRVRDAILGRD